MEENSSLYYSREFTKNTYIWIDIITPTDKSYSIWARYLSNKEYEDTFNQILSTFRFLDKGEEGSKIFTSTCGFKVSYPTGWTVADPPICGILKAPNSTNNNVPKNYGLAVRFSRTEIGTNTSIFNNGSYTPITINTVDDFIQSKKNDGVTISNIQNKSYGSLSGTTFTLTSGASGTTFSYFAFKSGSYIYTVDWEDIYAENYQDEISQILSTFQFIE
ncbi:MAG: hypothetical protein HYS98_05400 [Deltaproteobacteria bacterium]|nr:hypothetical protein [Deltaproteobacteria bacterium]